MNANDQVIPACPDWPMSLLISRLAEDPSSQSSNTKLDFNKGEMNLTPASDPTELFNYKAMNTSFLS